MRYTKPFTTPQRKTAAATYRSMRATYDNMRFHHRPLNAEQRRLVNGYRQAIMDFARVLRGEDATMDVARLNEAEERSVRLAVDYTTLRLDPEGRSNE